MQRVEEPWGEEDLSSVTDTIRFEVSAPDLAKVLTLCDDRGHSQTWPGHKG